MQLTKWALGLSLAGATLLSACGGGGSGSGDSANIRLLNATNSYSSLDLSVNDTTVNSGVAYAAVGSYASVGTSNTASQIQTTGVGTSVATTTPTLAKGSNYTMIAYGWSGAAKTALLEEQEAAPTATGKSKLLVYNLATAAGALDIYLSNVTDSVDNEALVASNISGGSSSGYQTINSGSYRVRIKGAGKTDIRLDIPSISLAAQGVATLIITPTDGGVLVNGILLAQQGTATNYATGVARARLVSTMAGNPSVTATANGSALLSSSVSPSIGEYQAITAGSSSLGLTVNGANISVANPTLKAGFDYTLVLMGDPANPTLSVVGDDNRLPTTAGSVKMRLLNGVASASGGYTLTVDYVALASNVIAGSASTPAVITSSTADNPSLLTVNSATSSTPVYTIGSLVVTGNGVYTVFMLDGSGGTTGVLRRER